MLFLFGTGKSTLKNQYPLQGCSCPSCHQNTSMVAGTIARYFHFFFIPVFPTSRDNVAVCNHCKGSFSYNQFTDEMKQSFDAQQAAHPNSRPVWHGCGCFIILIGIVCFIGLLVVGWFKSKDEPEKPKDKREAYLKADMKKATENPTMATDSTSFYIKDYMDDILENELNKKEIKYFSKINGDKILIILDINDLKKIKPSERYYIINFVKEALEEHVGYENLQQYIGVDGMWNMVLAVSPHYTDIDGKFAEESVLFPFYDAPKNYSEPVEITVKSNKTDLKEKK
jgi:hypothetical protein